MITAIYNFFRHETDRFTIGPVYLPHLVLDFSVSPFNWAQFQIGHPWMNRRFGIDNGGPNGFWLIIGPLDIGVSW